MKKRLLFLALFFASSWAVAQQRLILELGGGAADFREAHDPIFCPAAGVVIENPVGQRLNITTGAHWKRKGLRDRVADSLTVSTRLHYLQFELGCQYADPSGMRFSAGVYHGTLVWSSLVVELDGKKKRSPFPEGAGFTNDTGAFFEVAIRPKPGRPGLAFQYDLGLGNVADAGTFRTRAFTASLAIPIYTDPH